MPKNVDGEVKFPHIMFPKDVHARFKAMCKAKKVPMSRIAIELINAWVDASATPATKEAAPTAEPAAVDAPMPD